MHIAHQHLVAVSGKRAAVCARLRGGAPGENKARALVAVVLRALRAARARIFGLGACASSRERIILIF
eukprot:6192411-Pleurochrysis_carterae.AAC.2